MRATLYRTNYDEKQTLGEIQAGDDSVFSLELPWKDNKRRISCIPEGVYPVTKENHKKFGWCFRVHDVEGRSGILIHGGVHFGHTLGCILPGLDQKDITGDGELDNVKSKAALSVLLKHDITELEVVSRND